MWLERKGAHRFHKKKKQKFSCVVCAMRFCRPRILTHISVRAFLFYRLGFRPLTPCQNSNWSMPECPKTPSWWYIFPCTWWNSFCPSLYSSSLQVRNLWVRIWIWCQSGRIHLWFHIVVFNSIFLFCFSIKVVKWRKNYSNVKQFSLSIPRCL